MRRNTTPGTPPEDGWTITIGGGGTVVAKHVSGAYVVARTQLAPRPEGGGAFRIGSYRHWLEEGLVTDGPSAPLEWIEAELTRPERFAIVLAQLNQPADADEAIPMRLFPEDMPDELRRGRKPDSFYVKLAGYVEQCREYDIAAGPRLAADNGVSENTVRSWIHEARRRGLLPEAGA